MGDPTVGRIAAFEREVLALLARDTRATRALDRLVLGLEEIAAPGTLASVLLVDAKNRLRHGSAPSLPDTYNAAIDGLPIGPDVGSCGTAAWTRDTVIAADIAKDERWVRYRDLALGHGLRACWSVPIVASSGELLGTFAFYYREPRSPAESDLAAIADAARVARIVLERDRLEREHLQQRRREDALHAAARALTEAEDETRGLHDVLRAIVIALGWHAGAVWLLAEGTTLLCVATWKADDRFTRFVEETRRREFRLGQGLPGRVAERGEPEWLTVTADDPKFLRGPSAVDAGLTDGFALPIVAGGETLGAIELFTAVSEPVDDELLRALGTIGLQVGQFLRRSRVQAERARLVEELRETVHFSELFAGVLAHDLRNPLTAIAMGREILQRMVEDPRAAETFAQMHNSETRMVRMIGQLLDVTRSRSGGGMAITCAPLDLAKLTNTLLAEMRLAFPGHHISLEVEGDTRGSWDQDRLAQVLSNLVGNAVQHGTDGHVRVRLDGRAADVVLLETHNAGTIPARHLASIFDPFRRADTTVRKSEGLGLGLYITKLVVAAHHGEVGVRSDASGTTFEVRLPRARASSEADAQTP